MTVSLETTMQEVIEVTEKQAQEELRASLRVRARLIGESLIRIANKGCSVFGKTDLAQNVLLAGPGMLDMAIDIADKHYTLPAVETEHDQAIVFFELGVTKLIEQAKSEGLDGLF